MLLTKAKEQANSFHQTNAPIKQFLVPNTTDAGTDITTCGNTIYE